MTPAAALEGLLVADFSRVLAGPLATMTLGDLGADVIKVEPPGGDETRSWSPPETAAGATYFLAVNRNKRSVVLDLKLAEDRRTAAELAARADVVVDNFMPGALERFGLEPGGLRERNPRLVHCSITGFGSGEAAAGLPGYDPLIQALSGLMSITGSADGEASKVGVAVVDVVAGLGAAVAILAAVTARERSGEGQRIEIDLLGSALAALVNQASGYLNAGAVPQRRGNVHPSIEPFATYATADGPLMICAGNDRQFAALAAALGLPELMDDPEFADNRARVEHRERLRRLLEEQLTEAGVAEWTERLRRAGVPAGPVNDLAGAFALAADLGLDAVDEHEGVRTVASPLGLRGTPPSTRRAPPRLDEHGSEIRGWLGGAP